MVLTILIRPLVLGDVNLTVLALADYTIPEQCGRRGEKEVERSDTLIKSISVEAEGFKREATWNKYVCAEEIAEGNDSVEVWYVTPEDTIVEDSARAWVTVMGDLLALPLENLGSLIRMPYGCGEQNMINFAPNIYIMHYLEATDQGTPETVEKLLWYMRMGYQRELLFRRHDGSFSTFGNSDSSGSTWLTAFVLKCFAQARHYVTIDEVILEDMRDWLVETAIDKEGCLRCVGTVFNKALQGGLTSGTSRMPLTAYVLIAIYESGLDVDNGTHSDLVKCLVSPSKENQIDPYSLALKAYALVLAKDPSAEEVVQDLLEMATSDGPVLFWRLEEDGDSVGSQSARTVETAGYGLLAMLVLKPGKYSYEAKKIIQFIVSERNGDGGYYSTQDTVVALQALALYETIFYEKSLDVVATVMAHNLSRAFEVTAANKLLEQREALPVLPTNVSFTVEGRGCVVIQTVLRYNVPEANPSNAFSLRINATDDAQKCALKHIEICSAYLLPDGASNMAGIEINFVSGFVPPIEELERVVSENSEVLKRYEFEENRLTFYVSEFITGKEFCMDFDVVREVEVKDAKPGIAHVYDYYEPLVSVSKKFEFPPSEGC